MLLAEYPKLLMAEIGLKLMFRCWNKFHSQNKQKKNLWLHYL